MRLSQNRRCEQEVEAPGKLRRHIPAGLRQSPLCACLFDRCTGTSDPLICCVCARLLAALQSQDLYVAPDMRDLSQPPHLSKPLGGSARSCDISKMIARHTSTPCTMTEAIPQGFALAASPGCRPSSQGLSASDQHPQHHEA